MVRSVLSSFIKLGVFGLLGMGLLDSSVLFLPFGNDLLIVALTAREPDRWWLYAIAATAGSAMGAAVTDLLSRRLGKAGLEKMISPSRLEKVQRKLEKRTFWALALAALMPPPFPFTVFVIGAAALQISQRQVLTAVAAGRFVRFTALSLLAVQFGTQIMKLTKREELQYFVIALAAISIVGSALSIGKWMRSARGGSAPAPATEAA